MVKEYKCETDEKIYCFKAEFSQTISLVIGTDEQGEIIAFASSYPGSKSQQSFYPESGEEIVCQFAADRIASSCGVPAVVECHTGLPYEEGGNNEYLISKINDILVQISEDYGNI